MVIMAWRCPKCGEMAEDRSEACQSCGTINPYRAKQKAELNLAADQLLKTIDQTAREQAAEARLADKRQAARSVRGFSRLVEAWRLHRSRVAHPSRGQRPDLDRRWAYLYVSAAMLVGGAAASLVVTDDNWPDWLRENAIYVYIGVLALTAICWRRAVRGELGD
jgi:hypothetical protein